MYTPVCRADLGDAACTFPIWPNEVARSTAYALGVFVRASNPPGGPLAEDPQQPDEGSSATSSQRYRE
jgi:hypothetical protein